MTNPYRVDGPAAVSFSGGRSSAHMLYRIIDAHGGRLPDAVTPIFANTGKERPETLDFVRDCGRRWDVPIVWLEWRDEAATGQAFAVVGHDRAARDGEPFAALIAKRRYLPNPVTRFCTAELKVKTTERYCKRVLGWSAWTSALGLRADEPRRVSAMRRRNETGRDPWDTIMPMADAGATRRDVSAFWRAQPFDLRLPSVNNKTPHGNCDLCFMKSRATVKALIRENPEAADWWSRQERAVSGATQKPAGATFRKDRPDDATLRRIVRDQGDFEFEEEDAAMPCFCHD